MVARLAGHGKRVRANLDHVLPDMHESEKRKLVRAVPNMIGRTVIELFSPEEFAARSRAAPISGPGITDLEVSRDKRRPVILVSGHFGNYDAVRAGLIGRGFRIGGLYRPMGNAYFNTDYLATISKIGAPLFPRGRGGMADMVRFLKGGGGLAMLIDQRMHRGEPLTFFGQTGPSA